jgi:predicted ribosomally synthesized peptide with SipW-like signal peptide
MPILFASRKEMIMNKSASKKTLIASAAALSLSALLFAGTTYAWFTDSASSSTSVIKSGNLDVSFQVWNQEKGEYVEVQDGEDIFAAATGNTLDLWEPGHAEVAYLKVSNLGSLALRYQLTVDATSEKAGTNVDGQEFKLSSYLKFAQIDDVQVTKNDDGTVSGTYATRADALKAVENANGNSTDLGLEKYTDSDYLNPAGKDKSEMYVALVVYMPETVDNVANYKTAAADEEADKYQPSITLTASLFATQTPQEEDSFNEYYDEDAFQDYIMKNIATDNKDGSYTYDGATYINTGTEYVQIQQIEPEVALYSTVVGENETPTLYAKSSTGYVAVTEVSTGLYKAVDGNDQFATTADALNVAASNEGKVTLLTNTTKAFTGSNNSIAIVLLSSDVEIDLGNNSVSYTSESGENGFTTAEGINATIKNGIITQNFSVSSNYPVVKAYHSTVTLENITVDLQNTSKGTAVSAGADGGKLILKNCNIDFQTTSPWSPAVHCTSGSTVEIYDSSIAGWIYAGTNAIYKIYSGDFTKATFKGNDKSNFEVYGGTFSTNPEKLTVKLMGNYTITQNADETWTMVQTGE